MILLENYGVYGYTIYIRGYEDMDTKDIILDSYEVVGFEYTSKLFLEKVIDSEKLAICLINIYFLYLYKLTLS